MPKTDLSSELIRSKFENTLMRLGKIYSKIEEARITIKKQRTSGKRQNYEVSVLIITPHRNHIYRQVGWDLSNNCEILNQKLLRNLTKHDNKRLKTSIRKIKETNLLEEEV